MENNENKSFENEEDLQMNSAEETTEVVEEANAVVSENDNMETIDSENSESFEETTADENSEILSDGIETISDDANINPEIMAKPKSNKGIIAVISIVGVLLLAAIITLCYNFVFKVPTDGSAVILSSGKDKMIEDDFRYFMVGEAYKIQYAKLLDKVKQLDSNAGDDAINNIMKEYSWDTVDEETGKTYGEMAKENALNAALRQFVSLKKAEEFGVTLTDEEKAQVNSFADNNKTQYGDEYERVLISNGLKSHEQSIKMFESSQIIGNLTRKFAEDPASVGVTDLSELADYASNDSASVKHILLMTTDEETGEEMSDEKKAEVRAKAEEILARAKNGEDFDALVEEFNEDPGEPDEGYTFGPGEMVPQFETASFNLKIGEISDIVETSYGYHIIKRIAGFNDLQNKWIKESKVKVHQRALDKIVVQKDEENAFKAE